MDHIETAILNCYGIREAEQNMVFAARLTQHGHTIQSIVISAPIDQYLCDSKVPNRHCCLTISCS